jgi:hypothetical protein
VKCQARHNKPKTRGVCPFWRDFLDNRATLSIDDDRLYVLNRIPSPFADAA